MEVTQTLAAYLNIFEDQSHPPHDNSHSHRGSIPHQDNSEPHKNCLCHDRIGCDLMASEGRKQIHHHTGPEETIAKVPAIDTTAHSDVFCPHPHCIDLFWWYEEDLLNIRQVVVMFW